MSEKKKLAIIKIGGNVIDDTSQLETFLQKLSNINIPFILVHGGGKIATELSKKMGLIPQMVNGRRITDAETLSLVTMVYGGLINKNICAALQAKNINALGLTGADGGWIKAHKRPVKDIDYGFVGDVESVDASRLAVLVNAGFYPVIAPLTHDGKGHMLNTNADTMASVTAVALSSLYDVHLVYCFEKAGLLIDVDDENTLVTQVNLSDIKTLQEKGIIAGGMIPKTDNIADALQKGVQKISLCKADKVLEILSHHSHSGTTFVRS